MSKSDSARLVDRALAGEDLGQLAAEAGITKRHMQRLVADERKARRAVGEIKARTPPTSAPEAREAILRRLLAEEASLETDLDGLDALAARAIAEGDPRAAQSAVLAKAIIIDKLGDVEEAISRIEQSVAPAKKLRVNLARNVVGAA